MNMEITPQVPLNHQVRQPTGLGRLDLALVLSNGGRDPRKPQRLVYHPLGLLRHHRAGSGLVQRVLAEHPLPLDSQPAQPDVVFLRAREVEEGRPPLVHGNHTDVNLQT